MNPPLRSRDDDRAALIDALRDGTISAIATDHAPHARHEEVPFEEAPFGVTGLETAFSALYTHLVEPGTSPARDDPRADVGRGRARVRPDGAGRRGRRAREPRAARPEREWRVRRRLPLPLGELVAPRRDAARRCARPSRTDGWCSTDDGLPRARGRHGLPRRVGRGRGFAFGEAVFTTAMTGYQRRHRPELRRAARLLHGADGRELRRRRGAFRVEAAARAQS